MTGETTVLLQLAPRQATSAAVDYTVALQLPAGKTQLMGLLTVRAFDLATGLTTGALGRAEAQAEWVVTAGECA